jgi:hypothetical protein
LPEWLCAKAEEACDRVEEVMGVPVLGVRIAVGRTLDEVSRIVGQPVPSGPRGFFLGGRHAIVIMEPRNPHEAYALIAHETSHLLTSEMPGIVTLGVPPWFFEGIGIYISEQERLRHEIGVPSLLEQATRFALEGQVIDPRDPGDLMFWVSGRADSRTVGITMTQGYHLVNWMADEYGDKALQQVFRLMRENTSFPGAVRSAVGSDLGHISQRWKSILIT